MQSFNKEPDEYKDYNIIPGKNYHDAIQPIHKDTYGNTKLSNTVVVTHPAE